MLNMYKYTVMVKIMCINLGARLSSPYLFGYHQYIKPVQWLKNPKHKHRCRKFHIIYYLRVLKKYFEGAYQRPNHHLIALMLRVETYTKHLCPTKTRFK